MPFNKRWNVTYQNLQQSQRQSNDISYWHGFVNTFFSPKGFLRLSLWSQTEESTKSYEIPTSALARYYCSHFNSGVQSIQMYMENANQRDLSNGYHIVESDRCSFTYWFTNGHQVRTFCPISIAFKNLHDLAGVGR